MTTSADLTCATVNDQFARNDSMFGAWIHEQMRETDPWYNLIKKEAFPEGRGYTQRDIMIERMSTYDDQGSWTAITASNGSTINPLSLPAFTDLAWGQSYTNWSPYMNSYRTQCVSLDDFKFDHEITKQVQATVDQLALVTSEIMANRARYESARLMPAVSINPGYGNANGAYGIVDTTHAFGKTGLTLSSYQLNQSHLDDLWEACLKDGAGAASSRASVADGAAVLALITSRLRSDYIIKQAGIRDDYHWGDPGELLKPLGVRRVFRGFAHICDVEIPRFNFATNILSRVLPWSQSDADSGKKAVANPSWNSASYEYNYILPMDAFSFAVIKDSSSKEIAGASFEDYPYYYTAQAFWHNVKDNSTNTLGKLGRWLMMVANASHPHYPQRGRAILSLRCPNDQSFGACSYGT